MIACLLNSMLISFVEGEGRDNLDEPSHTIDLTGQAVEAMAAYRDQITRLMLANNTHH